ncbi:hypothetical protein A3715_20990 [Oleiphilus sp. HI0009]|nr:hypothetical protein A3715_14065 [Oleiphilus sp. HI0009]KZX77566.1 hypothetical protein A3715_20990 [Oleiphilus sp. HI0009]
MKITRIRSIGWLNSSDGSVNLTPCVDNNTFPTLVNISRIEFNAVKGCKEKTKQLAAQKLKL